MAQDREPAAPSGNIAQWSIDHPYTVIAFYLGVIILAVVAIGFYMPRRLMPYVQSPMIGVVSMMPGLSAQEMEIYISKPIEESLVNVQHLHFIRSVSQDGFSIVSLEFYYGTDMKKALFDVQALMNVIQANLPATGANLKPSWVLAIDPLNIPVLSLAMTGDGWDPVRLRELADNEVVNRLKEIPRVYSVVPFGGYKRQLQVVVDRNKLAAYGLSILDVKNAIDRANVSASAGVLTHGSHESIIRVDNRALDAATVANYPIEAVPGPAPGSSGTGMGGSESTGRAAGAAPAWNVAQRFRRYPRVVLVKDVARVLDTYWERRSAYYYAHEGRIQPAIEVSVVEDPDASSAQVVPAVMAEVKKMEAEHPGLHFQVAYDNAHFVNILYHNMLEELGTAVVLTGLAVLFFLGEWRGALISLTTIPISLSMAILCLIPMGMTLNSGTMVGLLISIGRLVDDSIINIHSIERHLRMGKGRVQATADGIMEVMLAVVASTFMLILALSPLLFCGGIVQLMFWELVWPIIFALLSSMVVSFTLTSLMASVLLRPMEERDREMRGWFYRFLLGPSQHFLERLEAGYKRSVGWVIHHRLVTLLVVGSVLALGLGFYNLIGSEMMPLGDVGQAFGVMEAVPGTSLAGTEKMATAVERLLLRQPEVEKVSTEMGQESLFESFTPFYTGYAMPLVNVASFMITLSDKSQRTRSIWDVIDSVQREALRTIPGIRRLQIKEMGSDVMASSAAPIQLLVYGKQFGLLAELTEQVRRIAARTPGLVQVATTWGLENPDWTVHLDLRRAAEVGLAPADVANQLYYETRGGLTSEFYRLPNLRQDTIFVRYARRDRLTHQDLADAYVTAPDGIQVPLKSIASLKLEADPTVVEHDGLRRVDDVTGYYRAGGPPSMDLTMSVLMKAITQINFPPGYGIDMRGDMTQMSDAFRRLLAGLGFAILFMLLVLVAQFRGILQPLQMVVSVPLELSGVFFALWLAHQAFSTVSIMAVIVLSGMDVTTAILLIDLIVSYREQGMARDQAILEACPQRLRPILMTSIITIVVMIPLSMFPKTGMDAYSPLGTVVLGGLIVGTLLSLFVIPVMHTLVDDLVKGPQSLLRRKPVSEVQP